MDWNIFWSAAGTICLFVGMIAGGGALFVRMTVHDQLAKFMKELKNDFATKEEVNAIWRVLERRKIPRP